VVEEMIRDIDIEDVIKKMTLEEKAQMCSGRDFWKTQDIENLGIPAVMMCDGPNGLRKQLGQADHLGINESIKTICYPTASAMASSFDKDLMRELGEVLGDECQSEQVGMLLGPGVNIKRSPLCGRNFEYFSEDPYLSGKMAAAYINGLQSKGVAACVKHFAVNNQETRRMSGSSQVDERTLHEIYLPAFEMAVKEGKTRGIMCAYNAINNVFCSENKVLLTNILRDDWGYNGLVVSDWGAVKDRVKGIKAGLDLEMPGSTKGKVDYILKSVESGELKEEDLNKAVKNILKFVNDYRKNQQNNVVFDRDDAHKKSIKFASESAVLLKNENILPLDKNIKAAFIGAFSENPRYQGAGSSHVNVEHTIAALECTEDLSVVYAKGYEVGSEKVNEVLFNEAVETAKEVQVAIIFAGLPESFEAEGYDREELRIPDNQNQLIEAIAELQDNTIVVLHGGSSMELPWFSKVKAVLCMHLSGDGVGQATVDLLYGKVNPSGKLAESWPIKLEDNPSYLNFPGEHGIVEYQEGIFIGYRYYDKKKMDVNFPFGYGLSYTTFKYSDFNLDKRCITDKDKVIVSCKIKNIGNYYGKEVVQLYVKVNNSDVRRPVRELKGFEKVELNPGEEKEITFTLDAKAFAYYETKISDWFIESGDVEIEIGASSRDIRLNGNLKVKSKMELPMEITKLTTIGELMKTKKGAEFVINFMSNIGMKSVSEKNYDETQNEDDCMGAGGEKMRQKMMFEMPLNALVAYGIMTNESLDTLIIEFNK
jgi:beta-glucosidase